MFYHRSTGYDPVLVLVVVEWGHGEMKEVFAETFKNLCLNYLSFSYFYLPFCYPKVLRFFSFEKNYAYASTSILSQSLSISARLSADSLIPLRILKNFLAVLTKYSLLAIRSERSVERVWTGI